jgi:hypothetical protein
LLCASDGEEVTVHHHLSGPLWGNLVIIGIAGAITLACFVAMFWMLLRPGENNPRHPKYVVLRDDR